MFFGKFYFSRWHTRWIDRCLINATTKQEVIRIVVLYIRTAPPNQTPIHTDTHTHTHTHTPRPNFFLRSSHIRVDLQAYESKPTDNREKYDWRAEKNLDGTHKERVHPKVVPTYNKYIRPSGTLSITKEDARNSRIFFYITLKALTMTLKIDCS